jgi:hypothetical protein
LIDAEPNRTEPLGRPEPEMVVALELRRLRNEVKALANWWDVLPQDNPRGGRMLWGNVFAPGKWSMQLAGSDMRTHIEVQAQGFDDRVELTLRVDNIVLWQRAIFYGPPSIPTFGLEDPT